MLFIFASLSLTRSIGLTQTYSTQQAPYKQFNICTRTVECLAPTVIASHSFSNCQTTRLYPSHAYPLDTVRCATETTSRNSLRLSKWACVCVWAVKSTRFAFSVQAIEKQQQMAQYAQPHSLTAQWTNYFVLFSRTLCPNVVFELRLNISIRFSTVIVLCVFFFCLKKNSVLSCKKFVVFLNLTRVLNTINRWINDNNSLKTF